MVIYRIGKWSNLFITVVLKLKEQTDNRYNLKMCIDSGPITNSLIMHDKVHSQK